MKYKQYTKNQILNKSFLIRKNEDEFIKKINEFNYEFDESIRWSNKIYNFFNNIKKPLICENCKKNKVEYLSFNRGYRLYCSSKCSNSSKYVKDKKQETSIKNYGYSHPMKNKTEYNKRKEIIKNKYGVENILDNNKIKEKVKQTNIKKFGVEYAIQNEKIKEKAKKTNLERYGVENVSQNKEIRKKVKQTNLERYGVETSFQSGLVKEKIKQTNLERYGVDYYVNSNKNKEHLKLIFDINKKIKWNEKLKISIDDIITSNNNTVVIKNLCSIHCDGFEISDHNLHNRVRYGIKNVCTICNPISEQSSIKENELKDFIKNELNLTIIEKDRSILNGKELDIYLPNFNLAIELNGLYWHSELFKDENYHLNKTEICNMKGIKLLHIFEDEWVYKPEIVKSIIKSKLGLIDDSIYGRKCEIKEISSSESKDFLENNHVQGNINASIKIGLYYSDELVSLMTFGKKRKVMGSTSEEGHYEMYRFCNILNTSIVGGASKLFKYFLKTYNPKEVISYADRRYFDGVLYEKLGFDFISSTKPNYWYIKGLERHYRYKFRKDVLVKEGFDSNKTEKEIMVERGYYRIYDCGNLKYIFNKYFD